MVKQCVIIGYFLRDNNKHGEGGSRRRHSDIFLHGKLHVYDTGVRHLSPPPGYPVKRKTSNAIPDHV